MTKFLFVVLTASLQLSSAIAEPTQFYSLAAARLDQGLLDGIQPGWTMTLNNDPSWQAAMEGHAIVGAAAISVQQFSKLFLRAAAPRDVSDIVAGPLSASGKLTVLRHGEEVTLNTCA